MLYASVMRLAVSSALGLAIAAAMIATPAEARADEENKRELCGTLGIDTTFMGAKDGPRGDLSYNFLTTLRAHFGLGPHASLSMGVGLPMLQLFLLGCVASGGRSGNNADIGAVVTAGIGVTTPIELRFTPERRSKDGVMFNVGASPVMDTAVVCALGGTCQGKKALALVLGYAATAGAGWQWKDGSFLSFAYSTGHLWPGGHAGGVDALEGMYYGGMLSFGFSLR